MATLLKVVGCLLILVGLPMTIYGPTSMWGMLVNCAGAMCLIFGGAFD